MRSYLLVVTDCLSWTTYHKHWTRGVTHDAFGDTSQEGVRQACPPMRTHHNQINLGTRRDLTDLPDGIPYDDLCCNRHCSGCFFGHETSEAFLRFGDDLLLHRRKVRHANVLRKGESPQWVNRVHEENRGLLVRCDIKRPLESRFGEYREINWDKDSLYPHTTPLE